MDDDSDYIVSDGNSAEDLLDDSNDTVSDLPAPPVSVAAPAAQRLPSNEDCGAGIAVQLLTHCIDLFGSATARDYEEMLQVRVALLLICNLWPSLCTMPFIPVTPSYLQAAEAEKNPGVARDLAGSWHTVIESAFDAETVRQMYNRAAKVCIAAKGSGAVHAQNVLQQALQRGIELDRELQKEIQQQSEKVQHDAPRHQQPTES